MRDCYTKTVIYQYVSGIQSILNSKSIPIRVNERKDILHEDENNVGNNLGYRSKMAKGTLANFVVAVCRTHRNFTINIQYYE